MKPMSNTRTDAALRAPPSSRFRGPIETALAEGQMADSMLLRLTRRDASLLTRDPSIPLADISYVGGVMRFLGVRVEAGGVESSSLEHDVA